MRNNSESLKEQITFQRPVYVTYESYNDPVIDHYDDVISIKAAYRDISSREFFSSQTENAEITGEFKIRYGIWYEAELDSTMRVKWGDRYFEIFPPRDITGRKQWLFINAKEVF